MTVRFLTTPGGEELAVMTRTDYEDLVDALSARDARDALASGAEELLDSDALRALLAAPSPMSFWRERRGFDLAGLASALDMSVLEAEALDRGTAPLGHYRRAASMLRVSVEDLLPGA